MARSLCFYFIFTHTVSVALLPALGEVTRFEITERADFADGEEFGEVGAYERIVGKVYFAIEPDKPQNQAIVDLKLAEQNGSGRVEFYSDLYILAPKDLSKSNGAALYDVNNRGNKLAIRFFNDSPGGNNPKSPGNGFLMRQGYTVVWSGWDGELLDGNARLRLHAPIADPPTGRVKGFVRYELLTNENDKTRLDVNGPGHGSYYPTEKGLAKATLTWRLYPNDRRVPIPRDQFKIHIEESGTDEPGRLPHLELELAAGFRPGYLYELIYQAQAPLVHGVCFASVRDLMTALKNGEGKGNPLLVDGESLIKYAYGFGVSQSGRFLRELLYSGFNADENNRKVFDGLIPHVAGGGLGSFNHRFAQPTAFVTQHQNHDWLSDRFPFTYETQEDPHSGVTDGILRRVDDNVMPKVMHTQSSSEYWSRAGSLVHTDPLGTRDSAVPENVRIYTFGGTQHGPGSYPPPHALGQLPDNPADYRPFLRSLLTALDGWCRDGMLPPPSVYPTVKAGTLVSFDQASTSFPTIPGLRYPEVIQQPSLLGLGRRWADQQIVDVQPPTKEKPYKVLVPKCGEDGNELGCLSPPEVAVPLATFTSWNLRKRDIGAEKDLASLKGAYIPFPSTATERENNADPRLSIQQRYGTIEKYLEQLETHCQELVKSRYLMKEDVERISQRQHDWAIPIFEKFQE